MRRDGGVAEESQGGKGVPQLSLPGGQVFGGAIGTGEPGPAGEA